MSSKFDRLAKEVRQINEQYYPKGNMYSGEPLEKSIGPTVSDLELHRLTKPSINLKKLLAEVEELNQTPLMKSQRQPIKISPAQMRNAVRTKLSGFRQKIGESLMQKSITGDDACRLQHQLNQISDRYGLWT